MVQDKQTSNKTNRIKLFIADNHHWFGFLIMASALLYAFITVLYEPRHILLDIIYGILLLFLIIGLFNAFMTEIKNKKIRRWNLVDGVLSATGVITTYFLVHYFEMNVVIASTCIGLLGHFLIKNYEVPVYCGSFAGMVSVALFDYQEVLILALLCAVIFMATKPFFTGYGGKLGTTAFMSSLILHSIFNDEFLVVEMDLRLLYLIAATILGVTATFYMQHKLHFSPVFASAFFSLVVGMILYYLLPVYEGYIVVFFSASFIGMSSKEKLPNYFLVFLSGVILGLVYYVFVHYFNGLGGKLGLLALISVMITTGISRLIQKEYHVHILNRH